MEITKHEALALYGGSAEQLARALGYRGRQAVYMWGDKVPEAAALKLRHEIKPEAFNRDGTLKASIRQEAKRLKARGKLRV
jgi:hypothetical protein